jgi:hypothetical protein
MRSKTRLIKKATAALLPLLLIFTLTGATIEGGLHFRVKETVIAENLDFTNYSSGLAASAAPSYYRDEDGSYVIWWEDNYNYATRDELEKNDPAYDNTYNHYLIRVYPGQPKKTKKIEIREWVSIQTDPRRIELILPSAMWQNERGNTVLLYVGFFYDEKDKTTYNNNGYDYTFEEYDKDFKLINKVVHKAPDLPGGEYANSYAFSAKDKDGNYYVATGLQILVFDKDYKLLGAVTDIPENTSELYGGGKYTFLMVNTGGDGAVYAYWYEAEMRKVYKIDPRTLSSRYVFDIDIEDGVILYPGMGTALFYGVGITLNSIDKQGKVKPVFEWGTNNIAPAFADNNLILEEFEDYDVGTFCFYEKNGNFYNFNLEDKDGDSKTKNDKQLVLYEFIRR